MNALTHRIGLILDLQQQVNDVHRQKIEQRLSSRKGIRSARFSRNSPDLVVIEYDPDITRPADIARKAHCLNRRLNLGITIKKQIFL